MICIRNMNNFPLTIRKQYEALSYKYIEDVLYIQLLNDWGNITMYPFYCFLLTENELSNIKELH